jgi:branched-chain amino acid aminotransferase
MIDTQTFDIELVKNSKITETDFNNLPFGSVYTDHMLICDFNNGVWETPKIIPYQPITLDPSAKVFHYGQAIFEGMKAYRDENDGIWLFRPEENFKRFNKSAKRLAMPEVPEYVFMDGLKKIVELDKEWVKYGEGRSLYLRPFMIATGKGVIAQPANFYRFMIIMSPAISYYNSAIKVIIAEHYSRAANGGIGAAKAAGNYAAGFYPTKLAQEKGFQQIIWTDDATHTLLEEAGTMNVFFRIKDTLYTAPTSDRILDGVTRKSIIDLARSKNIEVEVRPVKVSEIVEAQKNGTLNEIFGVGTAAIVNPIEGFSYQNEYYTIPVLENPYAKDLKQTMSGIYNNSIEDTFGWTVKVC